jgi:hypothetical protein
MARPECHALCCTERGHRRDILVVRFRLKKTDNPKSVRDRLSILRYIMIYQIHLPSTRGRWGEQVSNVIGSSTGQLHRSVWGWI